MIVNDTYRLAFVHIPKCGGTSVRSVLAPLDERKEAFLNRRRDTHPVLGLIDYHHIPLHVMRDYFEADFERLKTYHSYALFREPESRFLSSLHQSILTTSDRKIWEMPRSDVISESEKIIQKLMRYPENAPVIDPDIIHFSRQADYIELDGEKIVKNVFTLDNLSLMFREFEKITGLVFDPAAKLNSRVGYTSNVLRHADRLVQRAIMMHIPRHIWKPWFVRIRAALLLAGVLKDMRGVHADVIQHEPILTFIENFYRRDIEIYRDLLETQPELERRTAKPGTGP